jgi:hypothetical protein
MRRFAWPHALAALVILACSSGGGSDPSHHNPSPADRVAHIALTGPTTLSVGDTVTASAMAQDSLFQPLPTVTVTWQSLNTGVLTTTNHGFITAVGAGITILRLSAGNWSVDYTMTVNP